MNIKLLPLIAMFFGLTLSAQKIDTPENTYDIGGKIEFMTLTDAGIFLVGSNAGLTAIKPGVAQPHFTFTDYGKVNEEEVEIIPMTPYIIVHQPVKSTFAFSTASKRTVIDLISGKKVFATDENGWHSISETKIFLPDNQLVVVGNRTKKENEVLAAGIYDLDSGAQLGFVSLDPNIDKKVRSGLSIPVSTGSPFLANNKLYVPTSKSVVCADIQTGKILWDTDIKNLTSMQADDSGNEIYGFEERDKNTRIYKFDSNGNSLWTKEARVKGEITRFRILPNGIAVVSDVADSGAGGLNKLTSAKAESKIAFLNAADGTDLWDKAPKTKGYVQHFYVVDDGILFGIHSGGINKISFDGTPLFKKPLKTGEDIHVMATTPQGLIYITSSDADIINLSTGESIWNKPIKYKKADVVADTYDAKNQRYLISTGKELLAIDEKTGDITTLTEIKLEEKEVPSTVEVRDNGILLSSDQNLLMLNFDGTEQFHEHLRSPGKSAAGAILAGVGGVASVAAAAALATSAQRQVNFAGTNMATMGDYTEGGKAQLRAAGTFAAIGTQSFKEMSRRFSATAATENSQFILTKVDGDIALVKVNKDTGKSEGEIVIKDKKPEYEVDGLGGYLYYQSNNRTIEAFNLN